MVGLQKLRGVDPVVGLSLVRLDQQLFRLAVQPVGKVDVDLGYRVVLVGLAVGGGGRRGRLAVRRGEADGGPRGPRGRCAARRGVGCRSAGCRRVGRSRREFVGNLLVGGHASGRLRVELGLQGRRLLLVDELDIAVLETGQLVVLVLPATAHQQGAETEQADRARTGDA